MAFYTPTGKLKEVSTLTKGGAISTRNKEKIIQFIGNNDNIFRIDAQGHSEKNKPKKKEQEAMGREDINIKGSTMKEKKEQEMMGAEDVDIKGSTMREKKEQEMMGDEDVDVGSKELKKIDFDKLPPINSEREKELNKMKVDELKNILPNEKEYKKMKKDDLIKAILKKEGIRYGLKNIKNTYLYSQLEKLYNYHNPNNTNDPYSIYYNPYKKYNHFMRKIQEENKSIKDKEKQNPNSDRIWRSQIQRMRDRYIESLKEATREIKKYEELLKTDFTPLLE
jgi:hypothetical protein